MSKSIKKRIATLMMIGVMAIPSTYYAIEMQNTSVENEVSVTDVEEKENEYVKYQGKISRIMKREDNISIHVIADDKDDEYGYIFHMPEDVSLWNRKIEEVVGKEGLEEGMEVEVYYHQHTPMALSLPGQLTPRLVVIQDKDTYGPTYMGEFNEDLISIDNYLHLTIGEDTLIVNEAGEELAVEDMYDKISLVFYGASTRSIPAQTTPSKIVVMAEKDDTVVEEPEENEKEDEAVEDEVVEEVKEMIALRAIATELGYKVQWNADKSVELTKQNQTIVINLGKVDYTLNKSLGKFSKAPELKDGTMYVSASILDIMK